MRKGFFSLIFIVTSNMLNGQNLADFCYFFSHGLGDSHKQAYVYTQTLNAKKPYIIKQPLCTFDYPDVSTSIFRVNRLKTSLAQENEISCLAQHYFSKISQKPSLLVGVSRGASTLINFMSLYNPDNVCALLLESPFDSIDTIVNRLAHETKFGCLPGAKKYGLNLVSFVFCQYKPKGIKPINQVSLIRKDLPILLVCSLQDKVVPVWSTINLYCALRESGHENTYLLILPEGPHAKLINHAKFGSLYQHVAHAFYCKHGLPHDEYFAKLGASLLENLCQPSIDSLTQFYPHYARLNAKIPTKTAFTNNGIRKTINDSYKTRRP